MKYCRACKLRAKDADEVCSRCGGELGTLGGVSAAGGAPGDPAAEPSFALQGQIRELQRVQQVNLRRGRMLAIVCAVVFACLLLVAYEVYARTVLSYAVLENVRLEQDPKMDNNILVKFDVVKPGRVAFDRRSGTNHTEKLDVYDQPGHQGFSWAWPSDSATGIDFGVIYRSGWSRTFERKHFNVSGKASHVVDIMFLMDTTGSMTPFINGLRQKCIEFAEVVKKKGHNIRLGLIGFGDVRHNEPIFVLEPTADFAQFQGSVGQIPRTDGVDIPESGIEALQKALELTYRPGATVCFIHITDAPCHGEQRLSSMGSQLQQRGIVTFVVSRKSLAEFYAPLCVNGGTFHSIDDARFEDVLLAVAGSIANQIGNH